MDYGKLFAIDYEALKTLAECVLCVAISTIGMERTLSSKSRVMTYSTLISEIMIKLRDESVNC